MTTPDHPAPPLRRPEWILLLGLILVGAWLRLVDLDLGYLNSHTTRDLYRSQLLLRGVEFPLLGSEMMYGGRVLGPLMYFLCAVPLALWHSPLAIPLFIALVSTSMIPLVWWVGRRHFGVGVGLWTAAIFAVSPLEICATRFYWNPCFLPPLVTLALLGTLGVARGKPWHLLTAAIAIALGVQLHFSAVELIPSVILILLIARRGAPLRVWLTLIPILLFLFSPLLIHEITSDTGNMAAIVAADESHQETGDRLQFNANGPRNFLLHVAPEMNEPSGKLGFAYLETVTLIGETWIGPRKMMIVRASNLFSKVQLLLWAYGVFVCLSLIAQRWRRRKDPNANPHAMIGASTLIIWQAVPVLFLSFFNYHGGSGESDPAVSLRYYLVTYPAPHLTTAMGIVSVAALLKKTFAKRLFVGVVIAMLVGQFTFDVLYLQVIGRSGRFIPYNTSGAIPNYAPNMRTCIAVRDILLGDEGLDRDAWFHRTHAQQFSIRDFGEVSLDWLITQDPRSVTNSAPDPHLRWLLHSPFIGKDSGLPIPGANDWQSIDSPTPTLPEGATEVRRYAVGDSGVTVVVYVADPDAPIPDNERMRNIYYPEMMYLGPGRDLREDTMP